MDSPTYETGLLQVKSHRVLQASVSRILAEFNLVYSEWAILGILYKNPNGITHTEITKALAVEKPLITTLIEDLLKKDYALSKENPEDKRSKLLFLSTNGQTLIPKVEAKLRENLFRLLAGLTQDELKAYKKVLLKIIENAELN